MTVREQERHRRSSPHGLLRGAVLALSLLTGAQSTAAAATTDAALCEAKVSVSGDSDLRDCCHIAYYRMQVDITQQMLALVAEWANTTVNFKGDLMYNTVTEHCATGRSALRAGPCGDSKHLSRAVTRSCTTPPFTALQDMRRLGLVPPPPELPPSASVKREVRLKRLWYCYMLRWHIRAANV
jgi:hypothetical protein